MEKARINLKNIALLTLIIMLGVVACDPTEDVTPTDSPAAPTAIAKNPANVWIDQPLHGEALVIDSLPEQIVAHAAGLTGVAQLEIRDGNDAVLGVVDLGSPQDTIGTEAQISRYVSDWLPIFEDVLTNIQTSMIVKLVVRVDGVDSAPVVFTILRETMTPTSTPSVTPTESSTLTPTLTETATDIATAISTPTLTEEASLTDTPIVTPSPTLADTFTPTPTATDIEEAPPVAIIPWLTKDPIPCEVTAVGGQQVQGRVGPGNRRGVKLYIEAPDKYEAIAYNDNVGLWWLFQYSSAETAWVDDRYVDTTGSCLLLPYEEAPDVIIQQPTVGPTALPGEPVIYYFYADDTNLPVLNEDEDLIYCTLLHWDVEFVDGVFLNGEGVAGENVLQEVCITESDLEFTLEIFSDGEVADSRTVIITYGTSSTACLYITLSVDPPESGTASLDTSATCGEGGYNYGDTVTASAHTTEGSYFLGWSGTCPVIYGESSSTSFDITDSCTLIADFSYGSISTETEK